MCFRKKGKTIIIKKRHIINPFYFSWYSASVPANGTVMAVLLQNNVYEDILYGYYYY